jgi:hypothetical protein
MYNHNVYYFLDEKNVQIVRTSDNALIPQDESNYDYQEYLAWIAEGNTPELYDTGEDN